MERALKTVECAHVE